MHPILSLPPSPLASVLARFSLVERREVLVRHAVLAGVEVEQAAREVAKSISELSVRLRHLPCRAVGNMRVGGVPWCSELDGGGVDGLTRRTSTLTQAASPGSNAGCVSVIAKAFGPALRRTVRGFTTTRERRKLKQRRSQIRLTTSQTPSIPHSTLVLLTRIKGLSCLPTRRRTCLMMWSPTHTSPE